MNPSESPRPPRRWLRWLKRLGWCALWVVTLVALVVAFENWRGRRAWERFVAESKAAGEDVSPTAVIPPPVPDAENFAMIPLFQALFDYTNVITGGLTGTATWNNPEAKQRLYDLDILGPKPPPQAPWRSGKFTDLAAWQAHYRRLTNFPAAPQPQSAPDDVLLALGKFDRELAELRGGAARPHARFPIRYEESIGALFPHLEVLRKFSSLAQLHAVAELAAGKVEDAGRDTLLALRIAGLVETEPLLISQLVRFALLELALNPLWEGLARHQWSDAQLAEFEQHFNTLNFAASLQLALRGERNLLMFLGSDLMQKNPQLYAALIGVDGSGAFGVMPRSFIDQGKVVVGRMYAELLKDSSPDPHRFSRTHAAEVERQVAEIRTHPWRHPYSILAAMLMPALTVSIEKFARAQTTADLARVAIALERHRLKHGEYPETQEAIDPALKPAGGLPHDVISGAPLRYVRTAQGRFHLYAVGWNGTDEGGSVVWKDRGKTQIDFTQGDWVWQYPSQVSYE